MKLRLVFPVLFMVISVSLLSQQAEIVSITYEGDVAVLTRNTPPTGIIYYWQGTSCGTLMNHSGSTTLASSNGTYYLREYNSTGAAWATTCASTVVMIPDVTPPTLSGVTTGPVEVGDDIQATSNEDGMIYLVPDGTAANLGDITSAQVSQATAVANVASNLATTGIARGDYVVYAIDGADNISVASAAITLSWPSYIDISTVDKEKVKLYPGNVENILYIQTKIPVATINVYSLRGAQVMKITESVDQIDMGSLTTGVYIVSVRLEDGAVYSGKISKK